MRHTESMSDKTVKLDQEELEYIQSFLEAQTLRLQMLGEEQQQLPEFQEEFKIIDRLETKVA